MKTVPVQEQLNFLDSVSTVQIVEELGRRLGASGWIGEEIEVFDALERNIGAISQAAVSGARVRAKQQASGETTELRVRFAKTATKLKELVVSHVDPSVQRIQLLQAVEQEFLLPNDPISLPVISSGINIQYGNGQTKYGPGVNIEIDGDEVATAIDAWLVAHGVHVSGPRTVTVNGEFCKAGQIYVDPSGFVITPKGEKMSGSGTT
jgi:hypothetical protein